MSTLGVSPIRRPHLAPAFVHAIPTCDNGGIAVFDADGTLWRDDVADDFTTWFIDQGHAPGERWPTYMRIYRDDAVAGCEFLLGFYAGHRPDELDALVTYWWEHHADRHWVDEVVESAFVLADKGYTLWIVTGSPAALMTPVCRALPFESVVGMDFAVGADGRITGELEGISCAGLGKATKLEFLAGERPIRFCAGNGNLDGAMMELADVAWTVYPNAAFETFSRERGWAILPRPADFVEEQKFVLED